MILLVLKPAHFIIKVASDKVGRGCHLNTIKDIHEVQHIQPHPINYGVWQLEPEVII